ncbi:adenylate/guanylate cyclase domain-containing protein [Salinactinospora qingdaonensis]|uniref:Adenylate/guanylate cyclase domain-containing protein n=1 Tax=Salinactinospora qingdaonensis TaxID=702744 RepID=A0ABP7FZD0_9ACTN
MPSRPDPKEIEATLLGGEALYTREEAVQRAGVTHEFATRIWRALGFATRGEDVPAFTDSDIDALRTTAGLLSRGALDEQAAVRMARAMGQTMTRLAEWQISILASLTPAPQPDSGEGDESSLVGLTADLLPDVERLLVHIWRRQVAASATRTIAVLENSEDAAPNYFPLFVGFADLVSFTTLSRELDEMELAEVVEEFEATSADVVASSGGRLVKTLGDEILYVTTSAAPAAEIALQLADGIKTHVEVPDVRVGIAYGPVLALLGDVFGTTVNRANRLTSFARPGTVLIDEDLAGFLKDNNAYQVVSARPRHAHGLGQLQPYALRRSLAVSGADSATG